MRALKQEQAGRAQQRHREPDRAIRRAAERDGETAAITVTPASIQKTSSLTNSGVVDTKRGRRKANEPQAHQPRAKSANLRPVARRAATKATTPGRPGRWPTII